MPTITTAKTVQVAIDETLRHIHSGERVKKNKLAGALSTTDTTLTFTYDLDGIKPGSIIAVGLEEMYVWSVTESSKQALVERGQNGSVAATHAINAIVKVNPQFSDFAIAKALNAEINSLSSSLFQMKTVDFTYSASTAGFNLTGVTDILDIYEVVHKSPGLTGDWTPIRDWVLRRNQLISDFPSGYSVEFPFGAYPGQTVRILYKAPLTQFTDTTDDIPTVTGLPSTAVDIPPLGAAARLVAPREIRRANPNSQGDSKRAEEVPPGAQMRGAQGLLAIRDRRINEELILLTKKYPPKIN